MALLSRMIRSAAITGRTDHIGAWFGGRQGGRWAEQTVRAAIPTAAPHHPRTAPARRDPAESRRELTDLHAHGLLTEAEYEALRGQLEV